MEDETEFDLDVFADMGHCVAIATVVDDVHANPNIHAAKDALLVLLVLPCVVQEDSMQKFLRVYIRQRQQLYCLFAVATQGGFFFGITAV